MTRRDDAGSTLPLILGFFLIALVVVAGSVTLSQVFVQQRDLQDICDGAAAAAAASSADLDRTGAGQGRYLRFADVSREVHAYLDRDAARRTVRARAQLSADATRVTLDCTQTTTLALGKFFGRAHERHRASSSARAALID